MNSAPDNSVFLCEVYKLVNRNLNISSGLGQLNLTNEELLAAAKKYPYSLPVQASMGKQIRHTNKIDFNKFLKISAVLSPDRNWLYRFMSEENKVNLDSTLPSNNDSAEKQHFKEEKVFLTIEPETEVVDDEFKKEYFVHSPQIELLPETPVILQDQVLSIEDDVFESALHSVESITAEIQEPIVEVKEEKPDLKAQNIELTDKVSPVVHDSYLEREILKEAIDKTIQQEVSSFEHEPQVENNSNEQKSDSSVSSFNFWLNPVKNKEASRAEKLKKIDSLIEKFIKSEPRIVPKKAEFFSPVNVAKQSVSFDENLVSEPLASIFERQGYFDKAIKAYEKLSLKFPEKRAYFAARIEKIQEIIKNIKNNK